MAHHTRWLIRRDMPEVLEIEWAAFDHFWTEEDFLSVLRQRNCIGMIVSKSSCDPIAGFMIYELHKYKLRLLNMAVHPDMRRQGYGRAMIERLVGKLHPSRRKQIVLEVREENLCAQQFFRATGLVCTQVIRDHYADTDSDAYRFVFDIEAKELEQSASAVQQGNQ